MFMSTTKSNISRIQMHDAVVYSLKHFRNVPVRSVSQMGGVDSIVVGLIIVASSAVHTTYWASFSALARTMARPPVR